MNRERKKGWRITREWSWSVWNNLGTFNGDLEENVDFGSWKLKIHLKKKQKNYWSFRIWQFEKQKCNTGFYSELSIIESVAKGSNKNGSIAVKYGSSNNCREIFENRNTFTC